MEVYEAEWSNSTGADDEIRVSIRVASDAALMSNPLRRIVFNTLGDLVETLGHVPASGEVTVVDH
jgi:hypothetical protein